MGLSSALAFANASSPHGYQSTGLWACCNKYGEVEFERWFMAENYTVWGINIWCEIPIIYKSYPKGEFNNEKILVTVQFETRED